MTVLAHLELTKSLGFEWKADLNKPDLARLYSYRQVGTEPVRRAYTPMDWVVTRKELALLILKGELWKRIKSVGD